MIGSILTILGAAAKTAEALAEKAERGQLIDAGEARGLAKTMGDAHAQLAAFKTAADRIDVDGDFAERLRDEYTIHD